MAAFSSDIVEKFRSEILDQTFGDEVRYYVGVDDAWVVHLFAVVEAEGKKEEFQLSEPDFFPTAEDIVDQAVRAFDVDEDEVRRRLEKAREGLDERRQ
jgi:hypothetical protein